MFLKRTASCISQSPLFVVNSSRHHFGRRIAPGAGGVVAADGADAEPELGPAHQSGQRVFGLGAGHAVAPSMEKAKGQGERIKKYS